MAPTARKKHVLRKQMGLLFVLACGVAIRRREKRKEAEESNRRVGRLWVRPWLERRCETFSLDGELRLGYGAGFRNHLQMSTGVFEELCRLVAPSIKRQDTNMRLSISVAQRVALTLHFLATGETYQSLGCQYRISKSSISTIVPDTCAAIYMALKGDHLKLPCSEEEWMIIADEFNRRWQFPNCIGAIDGRHIIMHSVPGAGSQYCNFKGTQSIVMVAMFDAKYLITYVDIGCNGHVTDGGVLQDSTFNTTLFDDSSANVLNIPCPTPLPGRDRPVPFVVVGDSAFPLLNNLMKPYSTPNLSSDQHMFNIRLSRARHASENAFDIFAHHFRVFRNPINLCPSKIKKIVLSASALHNYLAATLDADGLYDNVEIEEDRDDILQLQQNCNDHTTSAAQEVRDEIMAYCVSDGQVSW